jgi:sporadic carbohydrate cluster protein (TIGR04323 family)
MSGNRQGFRGYVTSRAFGQYRIPVPLQALALRDYCTRKGLHFVLPANENNFPESYLVLEGLIQNLAGFGGIVMCSIHMLPQRPERRRQIYDRIIAFGCSLHTVLEAHVIGSAEDIGHVEELLMLSQIAHRLPYHMPTGG